MSESANRTLPTVLVLDDDPDIREEMCECLEDEGFHPLPAGNIESAWAQLEAHTVDLLLVDQQLPDGNGLDFAKAVRQQSGVGLIIVSGKTDVIDRVVGLEVGADDYITKPFSDRELIARVRTVLRRTNPAKYDAAAAKDSGVSISSANGPRPENDDTFEFLEWRLEMSAYRLMDPTGQEIALTTAEFELLRAFVENANRVLSRDFLMDRVHGRDWYGYDRGIDGLVSRLRSKVKPTATQSPLIKTIRGAGYMFTPKVQRDTR